MKTSNPINWDLLFDKIVLSLRIVEIVFGITLLFFTIYVFIQKGLQAGTLLGLIVWVIVGLVSCLLFLGMFAGEKLLLLIIAHFTDWLILNFDKHKEIRRWMIFVASFILFLTPFGLALSSSFWNTITDSLLRVIILISPFALSSALLSIFREEKSRNYIVRLTLLESALSNKISLLKDDDISDAIRMAEIYTLLHCYENSVRKLIEHTLVKELGNNWWEIAANEVMKRNVETRKQNEQNKRWVSPRGNTSPLYYLDWGDLEKLIRKYEKLFLPFIGELRFAESRFGDLENIRNIIAHNGVMPSEDDFQRVKLYFGDWNKQIGSHPKITKDVN
jgi:hypothetical protein